MEKQHYAFGQFIENKTIPVEFSPNILEDTNSLQNISPKSKPSITSSELDYLDELAFGKTFKETSLEKYDQIQVIKTEPEIMDNTVTQLSEPGLNEIDKQFFKRCAPFIAIMTQTFLRTFILLKSSQNIF